MNGKFSVNRFIVEFSKYYPFLPTEKHENITFSRVNINRLMFSFRLVLYFVLRPENSWNL